MCMTFPARILAVDEGALVMDHAGRRRHVDRRLVPDVRPGDDVLVGLGQILAHLTAEEADSVARDVASVSSGPSSATVAELHPPSQEPDRSVRAGT